MLSALRGLTPSVATTFSTSSSLIFVHLSSSFSRSSFALLSLPCYPRYRTHLNVGSSFDIFPSIMDFFRLVLTGGLLCCAVGRRAEIICAQWPTNNLRC
jgi:hypothetical protein